MIARTYPYGLGLCTRERSHWDHAGSKPSLIRTAHPATLDTASLCEHILVDNQEHEKKKCKTTYRITVSHAFTALIVVTILRAPGIKRFSTRAASRLMILALFCVWIIAKVGICTEEGTRQKC